LNDLLLSAATVGLHPQPESKTHARHAPWERYGWLIPFVLMLSLSWRGIDFGKHWDEPYNKTSAVSYSINTGFTLLPDSYVYPGVNYWLTAVCLTPEVADLAVHRRLTATEASPRLLAALNSPEFPLRARRLYSFIAALTTVWVYLTILVWRRSWPAALTGSMLIALSWEVVYHARWIAPDELVMQFGALTVFLTFLSWKRQQPRLLYLASVAAALACGAKYPGAMMLLPVLSGVWLSGLTLRHRIKTTIVALALFTVVYLASTPGTVLQPFKFYDSIQMVRNIYAKGWYGYSVNPGLGHFWKIFVYFSSQLFSSNTLVAIVLFLLVPAGLIVVLRGSRKAALMLLVFPVIYVIYFSGQRAMIVRNYLVLVPFAAILAGRGFEWMQAGLSKRRAARMGLTALLAILFSINAIDQVQASNSIAKRNDTRVFLHQFTNYVAGHNKLRILVSPALEVKLTGRGFWADNLISQKQFGFTRAFDEYASYYSETVSPRSYVWVTNRPGTFSHVFGPREINLDYYTGWPGDDRIILLTKSRVRKWGVDNRKP
jgi:hypothetical protein